MKRFVFPLDRVLRLRRLEMERVEARLSELSFHVQTRRRTAEQRREQAVESGQRLLQRTNLRGVDFRITGHWQARLETERVVAMQSAENFSRQHRQALASLVEARRKVRLLEILRERKHGAHKLDAAKQLEAQASEFFLAKRIREHR
jgi:flagellar export protein FliJ